MTGLRPTTAVLMLPAFFLAACAVLEPQGPGVSATDPIPVVKPMAAPGQAAPAAVAEPAAEPQKAAVFPGTGTFVDTSAGSNGQVSELPSGDITLNFAEAELREVVRVVVGDILGRNYTVDPKVTGSVTLQTSRPLTRSSVLPVLEEVLGLQGAAMVETGDLLKVVPLEAAARSGLAPRVGRSAPVRGRGFRLQVVPLAHISATQMWEILEPFVPAGRPVTVDHDRNVIILSGTAQEISGLVDMIDTFDVDWLAGMSFGLFPVQSTDSETMVDDLSKVFGDPDQGPMAGRIEFIPMDRMNAVLVLAQRADYLRKARTWIERLDRTIEGAGQRLFVYYVENRRAGDLAPVLMDAFTASTGTRETQGRVAPGLTRSELRSAGVESRQAAQTGAKQVAAGTETPPQPATAKKTPVGPRRPVAGVGGVGAGVDLARAPDVRIIADEKMNALLILASPRDYRSIESALRKLDVIPPQVLIEATIAEVTLNDTLKYGLQWFFESGNHGVNLSNDIDVAKFPGGIVESGFSYFFSAGTKAVTLNALDTLTDVRVISSPQLMVLDNETARLQVGDQVPVATQSSVNTSDPDAPIVNTIQQVDTGVILEVTPRVNANGLVILDILQEVSDAVATESSGIDSPTIQQRKIESSIAVQNGETIAMGGLIRDVADTKESGVPLLMNIPVLGHLFKTTTDNTRRRELIVLLTPRVVRDQIEARDVTQELRRKLRGLERLNLDQP